MEKRQSNLVKVQFYRFDNEHNGVLISPFSQCNTFGHLESHTVDNNTSRDRRDTGRDYEIHKSNETGRDELDFS